MEAATVGNAEIVSLLLEFGADSAKKDSGGHTALQIAEKKSNRDVVSLLHRPRN
jgi:ankyrin repeat protein